MAATVADPAEHRARLATWTSGPALHTVLRVERGPGASPGGYFVHAETMHGLFTFVDSPRGAFPDPAFPQLSHSESLLALLGTTWFGGATRAMSSTDRLRQLPFRGAPTSVPNTRFT